VGRAVQWPGAWGSGTVTARRGGGASAVHRRSQYAPFSHSPAGRATAHTAGTAIDRAATAIKSVSITVRLIFFTLNLIARLIQKFMQNIISFVAVCFINKSSRMT
jgi:hypothetical protein